MYWLRKRLWSQNFFSNRELIAKLVRGCSITPTDTVLDIGSGRGVITRELLKITPHVIAVEKDPKLTTHPQDFLSYPLPTLPYKLFANIPFSITGDVIRKLLQSPNPPSDCYLIVQSEAARKFMIKNHPNTMAAILYYPWWEIDIEHRFNRKDFSPMPNVDTVLLHIRPRLKPLLTLANRTRYYDFVASSFVHNNQAKFILPDEWVICFEKIKTSRIYAGAYPKLLKLQNQLKKIHRTRTDKNWKIYK